MIVWRDEMSVGLPPIDDDHKILISIINEFERMVAVDSSEAVLHRVVLRLQDYVMDHFSREEAALRECGFPDYEAHKREHDELVLKVTAFAQAYFIRRTRRPDRAALAEMARFLKDWFSDHTLRADLRAKPYLSRVLVDPAEQPNLQVLRPQARAPRPSWDRQPRARSA